MKIFKINSSKYAIEYEEGAEYNFKVTRCGEEVENLKHCNIILDMFMMLLAQQEELEKLRKQIEK